MKMIDLTAITTPFGLLDRETQEALKAHGGPWEYFGPGGDWRDWMNTQAWFLELAYRVKPAPPKPRTDDALLEGVMARLDDMRTTGLGSLREADNFIALLDTWAKHRGLI